MGFYSFFQGHDSTNTGTNIVCSLCSSLLRIQKKCRYSKCSRHYFSCLLFVATGLRFTFIKFSMNAYKTHWIFSEALLLTNTIYFIDAILNLRDDTTAKRWLGCDLSACLNFQDWVVHFLNFPIKSSLRDWQM